MAQTAIVSPAELASTRLPSIDTVRGLVMVIMPLEHAREFFASAPLADPVDLSTVSPGLFLTRLLTHLCAPTFVFLAGLAAAMGGRHATIVQRSRWLLVRGLWLMLLELTVVNFSWTFSFAYPRWFLQVIWALGLSMVALAGLIHLPWRTILLVGIAIVAGHNLLDGVRLTPDSPFHAIWAVLHQRDLIDIAGKTVRTSYPVLPWIGVMALGYCAGAFYTPAWDDRRRRRLFVQLGLTLLATFIVLRMANGYGEPSPLTGFADPVYTLFSVFNTTKYPPSLLFVLMTLGPLFLALAVAEQSRGGVARLLATYGCAPLFFYVAHWYVLHVLALAAAVWMGASWTEFNFAGHFAGLPQPLNFPLSTVYLVAAAAVALLYLPCKWIGLLKQQSRAPWTRFI